MNGASSHVLAAGHCEVVGSPSVGGASRVVFHGSACRGSALAEVLVSTLVLSILSVFAYGLVWAALASVRLQEVQSEVGAVTALAFAVWAQEVRVAGFDATGGGVDGLRVATPTALEVASDLNGDGDVDDPHERVAYAYDPARRQMTRATAGGTAQPFVTDVVPDGASFRYFDASGAEVAAPVEGLPPPARGRIRAVRFDLRVALTNPVPAAVGTVSLHTSSTVHLRNP